MNTDTAYLASRPVFFERNRVYRVYEGGKLFGDFFGDEPVDGNYPEEWVASTVRAMNMEVSSPREGLSIVKGQDLTFSELLEKEPLLMLGSRKKYDVLVKVLDSAIRLPLQAHPDKEFSRKYFHSEYGKTEMWLILAARENARVYFGFQSKLTKEEFADAVEKSRSDKNIMTSLLNEIAVQPGEVYLVPAKCVHAIGYGCLLLEVQEPTDFTIQPEYWCGEHLLSEYEMYLGVSKSEALDCFDYDVFGPRSILLSKKEPRTTFRDDHVHLEDLLTYRDTPCFCVKRITVSDGSSVLTEGPALYLVTEGEGVLRGNKEVIPVRKGSYFFLPHNAVGRYEVSSGSRIQLAVCLPPRV